MRWPWQRSRSAHQLVLSWSGKALAYVTASPLGDGSFEVMQLGVIRQGDESLDEFTRSLQTLGFKGMDATVMLRSPQYQWLQIDTPNVPPEELRSAARYQVREMLQTHVDDVTLDVMRVGDGQHKGAGSSFVVAATNAVVAEVLAMVSALNCNVSIIDVQETAQRNLQSALALRDGSLERANAELILIEGQQAMLTISANQELFYTRRFDVPEGFLAATWGQGVAAEAPIDGFTPVQEYVPNYAVGDISLGSEYAASSHAPTNVRGDSSSLDDDKAQRLVLEIQRSLDVWDRTWSSLPLNGLRVFAGDRSAELASWLVQQLGQTVTPLDVGEIFLGLDSVNASDLAMCLPLLGVLLRSEDSSL